MIPIRLEGTRELILENLPYIVMYSLSSERVRNRSRGSPLMIVRRSSGMSRLSRFRTGAEMER
jgi:hypothetical protein